MFKPPPLFPAFLQILILRCPRWPSLAAEALLSPLSLRHSLHAHHRLTPLLCFPLGPLPPCLVPKRARRGLIAPAGCPCLTSAAWRAHPPSSGLTFTAFCAPSSLLLLFLLLLLPCSSAHRLHFSCPVCDASVSQVPACSPPPSPAAP